MALQGERQPLLVPREEDEFDDHDEDYQQVPQDSFATSDRVTVLVLLALIVFTKSVGSSLYSSAMFRVEYAINCHNFQPNQTHEPSPLLCRSPRADAEFLTIETWRNYIGLLVALLTAVPYGLAADKLSRRNVLTLCVGGILLSMAAEIIICLFPSFFALRLVWLTTSLTLIGGGPLVFSAVVNAIASDVSSNTYRVTIFLLIEALNTVAFQISQPISMQFMIKRPWLAVYIGLASTCISTILILFLPSTRDIASLASSGSPHDGEIESRDNFNMRLYSSSKRAAKRVVSVARLVTVHNKRLGLILLGVFFFSMSSFSPALAIFYVLKRLAWSMQDAILVNTVKLWSSLIIIAIVLPTTSQILTRLQYNPVEKDLWLARGIILPVVAGLCITGFSNGRAMVIIGTVLLSSDSAFAPVARSLLVLFNGEQHTGVLFTLVDALRNIAALVGLPTLKWLFETGSNWEAGWLALPFVMLAILTAVAGGTVANFRAREPDVEGRQEITEDR